MASSVVIGRPATNGHHFESNNVFAKPLTGGKYNESNVFGKPVTEGNRCERAHKAYKHPNAHGKRDEALAYVRKEKEKYGVGASTLCIFYNATGEDLIYVKDHSYYGKIYDSYPTRVQNGQWGAFLHVKTPILPSGSVGYVLYRGKANGQQFCNELLGWDTPWDQVLENNHAYCDIYNDGCVDSDSEIYRKMEASGRQHIVKKKGIIITTNIEEASSPLYEAKLTLEDVTTANA